MGHHFTVRKGMRITKTGYKTKKLALAALNKTAKRKNFAPGYMSVYKCPVCKKYHFGRDRHKEQEQEHGRQKTI